MIKLIVTDVDGVLVGSKKGYNFPTPSKIVVEALKKLKIPVVFCSGKYRSGIEPAIIMANLKNPHITDSGALIINPLEKKIIKEFVIEEEIVLKILSTCLDEDIYVETFASSHYFIQGDQVSNLTPKRTAILQEKPVLVESIASYAKGKRIIKLLLIAKDENDRKRLESILGKYSGMVNFNWSKHPTTHPLEYLLITSKKASKLESTKEVVSLLGISLYDVLGIGDTFGDLEFMKICGFVATMDDADIKMKEEVKNHGLGKYFIAPSVDEDGMIKILENFKCI